MSVKEGLRIVIILAALYAAFPYLLKVSFWLFYTPQVEVSYDTAITGRITGVDVIRQYHLHYLDGSTKTKYNFNLFVPSTASPHTAGLPPEKVHELVLGTNLQVGDYVTKSAHSTNLLVRRGNSTSQWICSPNSPKK